MKSNKNYGLIFILPSLVGVLVFYIIPFFLSLFYTFTQGITEVKFVWFKNFTDLFMNQAFLLATKNTLIFMGIGVPLLTLSALLLSKIMSDKLYSFPRGAILSPIIVPVASSLMGWSAIFGDAGIVNKIIGYFGVNSLDFFGEKYNVALFLLIFVIKNLGYMVVIFSSSIASLSKKYKEVFLLDSSSEIKYTFKVIVPLISPIIFFVVILSIMNCFQIFREVYGIYGNFPPNSMYTLQYFMNNNFYKLNYQRLSTAAFVLIITLSVLISVYLRYQNKRSSN